jgi:hypothetical protein
MKTAKKEKDKSKEKSSEKRCGSSSSSSSSLRLLLLLFYPFCFIWSLVLMFRDVFDKIKTEKSLSSSSLQDNDMKEDELPSMLQIGINSDFSKDFYLFQSM